MLSEMKKKFAQHRIITQPFQLFFYNLTGFILDVIVVLFYRFIHTIVYFRVRKNRDYRNFFVTGHFGLHFFAVHYDLGVENLLLDAFTEKSLDAYKFNLLHNKQLFIRQLKQNRMGVRTIDEGSMDEGSGMNFSEYVAVLSTCWKKYVWKRRSQDWRASGRTLSAANRRAVTVLTTR